MSKLSLLVAATGAAVSMAAAQAAASDELESAQRQALAPLAVLDGTWRGPATVTQPDGTQLQLTQTERVGPLLGGAIRVIEGRGYGADGKPAFNAFAVLSFDAQTRQYNFRSYAHGRVGDFPVELRPDGFAWTLQAGPALRIRYTVSVRDGEWHEIGEMLMDGKPPRRNFEMRLKRVGDTDWPAAGALPPR